MTRAITAFEKVRAPTPTAPLTGAQAEIYERKRAALIRALERAGLSPPAIRARLGWIKRRKQVRRGTLAETRAAVLGADTFDASTREGWIALRNMVRDRDPRFQRFVEFAEEQGVSFDEAVDNWFSPKAR